MLTGVLSTQLVPSFNKIIIIIYMQIENPYNKACL